ncbi:MAG: hypothetical protein WDW36_002536 [Sanguina aurantia]
MASTRHWFRSMAAPAPTSACHQPGAASRSSVTTSRSADMPPWTMTVGASGAPHQAYRTSTSTAPVPYLGFSVTRRALLIPMTDAFGFGQDGMIEIAISAVTIYRDHKEGDANTRYDKFGFFLSPVEADSSLEQDLVDDDKCILDNVPDLLLPFSDSSIQRIIHDKTNFTITIPVPRSGLFYLYFANCLKETPVSFTAVIQLYNINDNGRRDYLSIGDTDLDKVYWVMFVMFAACCSTWAYFLHLNKSTTHKVHYLMLALVGAKALTVLSQALMCHYIEFTGHADGWNIAYYFFTFVRGMLFFTVVVLVGTGWSYMKPFLGDREKRILLVVVPLQVFANIAIVITEEESPAVKDWFTWRDVFHLVDIICCCAILFPIVWSIKHLREASQTDGKAARNLHKLTLFRQFYIMVVIYIYFTRIVVYLLKNTMQYEYSWMSEAADQLATLAFYIWTAYKFRPQLDNAYLRLEQSEIEL